MAKQGPSLFPIPEGIARVRGPNETTVVSNDGSFQLGLVDARYVDGLARFRAYGGITDSQQSAPTSNTKTDHNDY